MSTFGSNPHDALTALEQGVQSPSHQASHRQESPEPPSMSELTDPSPASTAPSSAAHDDVVDRDFKAPSPPSEAEIFHTTPLPESAPVTSQTPAKPRSLSSAKRRYLSSGSFRSIRHGDSSRSSRSASPSAPVFPGRGIAPGSESRYTGHAYAYSPGANSLVDESLGDRNESFGLAPGAPSRYLVTVIPPPHLPADPPRISPACSGYGPPASFRRGCLVPLYRTLSSQIAAIAREYGLPSTGGVVLYLLEGSSATGAIGEQLANGPRIGEEAWRLLWAGIFEEEAALLEAEHERSRLTQASQVTADDESSASEYGDREPLPPVPPIPFPHRAAFMGDAAQVAVGDDHSPGPHHGELAPSTPNEESSLSGQSSAGALAGRLLGQPVIDADEGRQSSGTRSAKGGLPLRSQHFQEDVVGDHRPSSGARRGSTPAGTVFGSTPAGSPLTRSLSSASRRNRRPRGITAAPASAPNALVGSAPSVTSRQSDHGDASFAENSPLRAVRAQEGLPPRPVGAGVIVGKVEFDVDTRRGAGRWFEAWTNAASRGTHSVDTLPSGQKLLTPSASVAGAADEADGAASLKPLRLLGSQQNPGRDFEQRPRTSTEVSDNPTVRLEPASAHLPESMPEPDDLTASALVGLDSNIAPTTHAASVTSQSSDSSFAQQSEMPYQQLVDRGSDDGASTPEVEGLTPDAGMSGDGEDPLADVFGSDASTWNKGTSELHGPFASAVDADEARSPPRGLGILDTSDTPDVRDQAFAREAEVPELHNSTAGRESHTPASVDVDEVAQLLAEKRQNLDPLSSPIHLGTPTMEGPPPLDVRATPPPRSPDIFVPPSRKSSRKSPLRDVGNSAPPPLPPLTPTRPTGDVENRDPGSSLAPAVNPSGQRLSTLEMTANLDSLERALAELSPRALKGSPQQHTFAAINGAYKAAVLPPITMTEPSPHQRSEPARKASVGETDGYGGMTVEEMEAPITPGVEGGAASSPNGTVGSVAGSSPPATDVTRKSGTSPPAAEPGRAMSGSSSAGSLSPKGGSPTQLLAASRSAPFAALREKAAKSFSRNGASDPARPKSPASSFRSARSGAKAAVFNFWQAKHQSPTGETSLASAPPSPPPASATVELPWASASEAEHEAPVTSRSAAVGGEVLRPKQAATADQPQDLGSAPGSPFGMPATYPSQPSASASPGPAEQGLAPSPVPSSRLSGLLNSFDDLEYQ